MLTGDVGPFRDRREAGRLLAAELDRYAGKDDVVVLGLPRGGIPVASEVAASLEAPLDVFVVRKLGLPEQEELAMGAIASGGVLVLNEQVVKEAAVGAEVIAEVAAREQAEIERREQIYRDGHSPIDVRGRTVILIDDGLATGATMRAAAAALRRKEPARLVVAVPTAARSAYEELAREVDEIVCLRIPQPFGAVGAWYEDFVQTTDEEVRDLLMRARRKHGSRAPEAASPERRRSVA